MKKTLTLLGIIALAMTSSITMAVTIGKQPPADYMKNLKSCTASSAKNNSGTVDEYTIKGLLPDGRCEVEITSYTNFEDPKVYEGFITILKAFGGEKLNPADIPTQAQMIEQGKKEKDVTVCKFTKEQRFALHAAYLKNDGKNNNCVTKPDGTTSCRYSTEDMSSYDRLMTNYSQGTCSNQ